MEMCFFAKNHSVRNTMNTIYCCPVKYLLLLMFQKCFVVKTKKQKKKLNSNMEFSFFFDVKYFYRTAIKSNIILHLMHLQKKLNSPFQNTNSII